MDYTLRKGKIAVRAFGNMLKILYAVGLVLVGAGSANAADLQIEAPRDAVSVSAVTDWTGFYTGLQGGYGWGKFDFVDDFANAGLVINTAEYDLDGWFGGAHIGYSYQVGQLVLGLETEINFSNIDGSGGSPVSDPADIVSGKADWFGSVALRAGYAFDSIQLYAVGGWAYGGFDYSISDVSFQVTESFGKTQDGWVAGGGIAWMVRTNTILSFDYRYYAFEDVSFIASTGFYSGDRVVFEPRIHTIRGSIAYKF